MASRELAAICRDLDLIANAGTVAGMGDAELLERFIRHRGKEDAEVAFEAILLRHGPMVRGICRSLLGKSTDSEDAFQATFLILVRKAHSVRIKDSLRPWLYGVTWRVARKAQSLSRKRQGRETSGNLDQLAQAQPPEASDLLAILLGELEGLPERYRRPIALCHLEGFSHEEVARELGCPIGTISSRLSRGRELLRSRLVRKGLGVPTVLVASAMSARGKSTLSPALIRSTVRAASGGVVSSSVQHLTRGVIVSMLFNKMKLAGLLALSGALTVGAASGRFSIVEAQQDEPKSLGNPGAEPKGEDPKVPADIAFNPLEFAVPQQPIEDPGPPREASVEAPALSGITIDGDLKDWPAAMPRYPIKTVHVLQPYYGYNGLARADLSTSPDLSAAFSVGYDPNEQVIYVAVIVRDDKLIVGNTDFWDTDSVEVFVDGRHTEETIRFPEDKTGETLDASDLPLLQYIAIPGEGRVYGVKKSVGQERAADNPILMFGDIHKTKTKMAYRRSGDVTIYEWAIQPFDHYPDKPTQLIPFKKIGFDLAVVDKDKPAATQAPETEPEEDRCAWISWSPPYTPPAFLRADRLGEIILGRIP
ncbi:sigma-70 family RNA polymerase sigma factor [Tundrisphaera lichenicola]|uniref:sigma-70 family RNA polymerase sigma factor n=1 Tax=Tundrisphaera lichenicola TaxID=2029860 RepID=UPI003EC149D3